MARYNTNIPAIIYLCVLLRICRSECWVRSARGQHSPRISALHPFQVLPDHRNVSYPNLNLTLFHIAELIRPNLICRSSEGVTNRVINSPFGFNSVAVDLLPVPPYPDHVRHFLCVIVCFRTCAAATATAPSSAAQDGCQLGQVRSYHR